MTWPQITEASLVLNLTGGTPVTFTIPNGASGKRPRFACFQSDGTAQEYAQVLLGTTTGDPTKGFATRRDGQIIVQVSNIESGRVQASADLTFRVVPIEDRE